MSEPKIGVFICHCGTNIAGKVDVQRVAEYAKTLPGVVLARDYRYMCSDPGQALIKEAAQREGIDRVIVAACSPRMHEPTFRKATAAAGINEYLYEHVNIREHCSWVHEDRGIATRKAEDLVRGGVGRVRHHEPLVRREVPVRPSVLVVGGGIAGMQAALDIAAGGHQVYLVEREATIGGKMAQLDRTFPSLDCSECIMTPKMSDVGHHPNIELLTYAEVQQVSGSVGDFHVKVLKRARFVDEDKCVGCGLCSEKCPWKTESEFEAGMEKRKAIYIPFAQAIPNIATIDKDLCVYLRKGKGCRLCEKVCDPGAIDFEQQDEIVELDVGTIIVATGYHLFDPSVITQYGYKRLPNVMTSLEFERITCAAGPTGGKIQLADGRRPESVAIVHCVGSRDKNHHEYCSRVCCMYGLKYAHMIKEMTGAEVYQFYIDMRCFGEGYEEFYERVSSEGVVFVRGKVARITDDAQGAAEQGKLIVEAENTLLGQNVRVPVDMAILCAALEPQQDSDQVARLFNLSRRADGFFLERHIKLDPVATSTEGVFICGCCQGPRDIPDTVAQAEAAAAKVLSLISKGSITLEAATALVDHARCVGCGRCEEGCSFSAPTVALVDGRLISTVNEALCKGCGACATRCPTGAIMVRHFTEDQIMSQIAALTENIAEEG